MDITAMKRGPEMNAIVAKTIMEFSSIDKFSPSSEIAAAWMVVEEMARKGFQVLIKSAAVPGGLVLVGFLPHGEWSAYATPKFQSTASDVPEAICRAALLAVAS